MRRIKILSVILAFLFIVNFVFSYICYKKNVEIKENLALLIEERDSLILEKELLKSDLNYANQRIGLLVEDVANIYKGCINEEPCKGHYPEVRWYCNVEGDEVSDPSHVCVCDASCQMSATQL